MGAVIHAPDREKNTLSRDVRIIIIRKIRCILEICKDVLFLGIMQIFYKFFLTTKLLLFVLEHLRK